MDLTGTSTGQNGKGKFGQLRRSLARAWDHSQNGCHPPKDLPLSTVTHWDRVGGASRLRAQFNLESGHPDIPGEAVGGRTEGPAASQERRRTSLAFMLVLTEWFIKCQDVHCLPGTKRSANK